VLPLAAAVILAREWRVVGGWAVAALLLAAAVTVRAPNLVADWVGFAGAQAGHIGAELALVGLVYPFPLPRTVALVLALAATAGAVVVLLVLARARREAPATAVAIRVAGGMLAAPHALGSDLVLLSAAGAVWPGTRWFDWLALSAVSLFAVFNPSVIGTIASVALVVAALVRLTYSGRQPSAAAARLPSRPA
jgi:hypothetical protein